MTTKTTIDELAEEFATAAEASKAAPDQETIDRIANTGRGVGADYVTKLRRLGSRWRDVLATPAPHDELSETRMALIDALVKRNFTDGEVFETLAASAWLADLARRKGEKHAEHLIAVEIAKARSVVTPFPPDPPETPIDFSDIRRQRQSTNGSTPHEDPEDADTREPSKPRSLPRFPRTDTGQAELFAHLYGAGVRYDHTRGLWLVWARHWWRVDNTSEVVRLAIEAARQRYLGAMNIPDEPDRQAEAKFAIGSENRAKIDASLAIARAVQPIADAGDGWDSNPMLLGVENGVLDLRSGDLRAGRPADKISRHAPLTFDPAAQCPMFEAWLAEMQPNREMRRYLQRNCGMALTGDVGAQIVLFFYGPLGRNGKTTLVLIMLAVLGRDYATMAAPGLLLKKRGEAHPTELADTNGKRLVVSVEPDDGRAFAEALLKQLSGGDRMKARYMHADFFEFTPSAKFWIVGNHKPAVRGQDQAFWRRMKLIPFDVSIPEERVDPHLVERLLSEAPGILTWALRGCLDWQRDGLAEPDAVRSAVEGYKQESDELRPFFDDRCVFGADQSVRATLLYKAYRQWAKEIGIDRDALSQTKFGTRIGEHFASGRDVGGKVYRGIGLGINPTMDWSNDGHA